MAPTEVSRSALRRALLVEDEAVFREGLRGLLTAAEGFSVVADCATVAEARKALGRGLAFEVALVDLALPDGSGLEVVREISQLAPDAHVLVLTKFAETDEIVAALRAGAVGYLLKHTPPRQLLRALHEACDGGAPMNPQIARKLVESLRPPAPVEGDDAALTQREREVLTQLATGARYAEVSRALDVSESTIQTHIKSIYRKLRVRSKAEATREALRRRLIDP